MILFGSYARGDAREDSDVDFLVVQPGPKGEVEEMIRLRDLLRPLRIPADVLVTSQRHFEYWAETPGTVYHEAATGGLSLSAPLTDPGICRVPFTPPSRIPINSETGTLEP